LKSELICAEVVYFILWVSCGNHFAGPSGRSSAEVVGPKHTGVWMCVCCECCVLSGRGLSVVSVVCCQVEVCCECCVLSGRGLCDELITRPEESYRRVCDLETSWIRRPLGGCCARNKQTNKQTKVTISLFIR
jgi:hypothetical protein